MRSLCLALAFPAAAEEKKPAPAAAPASPASDTDRALRAIGLSIAQSLAPFTLSQAELEKVLAAVREGLGPTAPRPDERAQADIRALAQARAAAVAEKEKARGAAVVAAAEKEKGAIRTPNGAVVVPIKVGTGASPSAADRVKVHYTGTLLDGKVFDSSRERNQPAEFPLGGVIPCWTEGLQQMKVGGRAKLVCAPGIAYGERGMPPAIPAGATLTFDVELLAIVKDAPAGK